MAKINVTIAMLVVRSSREKNREFSWCCWTVNISAKYSAVAHCDRDAVFHSHGIGLYCSSELRNESQNCERAEQDRSIDRRHVQANHSFSAGFSTNRIKPKRSGT